MTNKLKRLVSQATARAEETRSRAGASPNRPRGRTNQAETYQGPPCRKCGATAYAKADDKCIACRRETGRRSWARKLPSRMKHWADVLINQARKRCRERGHPPPTITRAWIEEQLEIYSNCYFTGVPLIPPPHDVHAGQRCPWAPSLDRIDNSKSYTPENTRVTSAFWNHFRGDLPEDVAFKHLHQMARCIVYGRTPRTLKTSEAQGTITVPEGKTRP